MRGLWIEIERAKRGKANACDCGAVLLRLTDEKRNTLRNCPLGINAGLDP